MEPATAPHLCCSTSREWSRYRRCRGQFEYVIPGFIIFTSISGVDLLSLSQLQLYLPQHTEILGVASYCSRRCSPATSYAASAVHRRGANKTPASAVQRQKWRKAGGVGRSATARLKRSTTLREHASSRPLWRDWKATLGPNPPPLRRPINNRRVICALFTGAC